MARLVKDILEEANKLHQSLGKHPPREKLMAVAEQYEELLNQFPEDPSLIFLSGTIQLQMGHNGHAIQLFKRAQAYMPQFVEAWNNEGSAWKGEHNNKEAERCFKKALSLNEDYDYYNNLATLYINEGCPEKGLEYAKKAMEGGQAQPEWNLSLIELEMGDFDQGFLHYDAGLKSGDRPDRYYDQDVEKIPHWDGKRRKIVAYDEQGMGDCIMFASCLQELIDDNDQVILDCRPRLEGLYRRSFPNLKAIYPTSKKNEMDWPPQHDIEQKIATGSLLKHYRRQGKFPRTPYLKPDPLRVEEYREWLRCLGPGPYIGVAYHGGAKKTRHDQRAFQLSPLKPIFEQDATFISLDYIPDADRKYQQFYEDTGIKVHHWPEVLRAFDYDETVALIEALDLCIIPNQTAVHVCGAIGKECWSLTPDACAWRYTPTQGDKMAFYGSVKLYRENGDWEKTIERLANDLESYLRKVEAA